MKIRERIFIEMEEPRAPENLRISGRRADRRKCFRYHGATFQYIGMLRSRSDLVSQRETNLVCALVSETAFPARRSLGTIESTGLYPACVSGARVAGND
jgi:hypothetical protein